MRLGQHTHQAGDRHQRYVNAGRRRCGGAKQWGLRLSWLVVAAPIALGCVLAPLAAQAQTGSTQLSNRKGAWDYYRLGDYKRALPLLSREARIYPKSAPTHSALGWCYHMLGRYDEAEGAFNTCLELDPGYEWAHKGLAAVGTARRAVLTIAAAELAAGRYQQALATYDQALAANAATPQEDRYLAYLGRGWCHYYLKDQRKAISAFRRTLRLKSGLAEAHRGLGYCFYERNSYREALSALKSALTTEPDDLVARLTTAWCHVALGDLTSALEHIDRAQEAHPNAYGPPYARGIVALKQRNGAKAKEAFNQALATSALAMTAELQSEIASRRDWYVLMESYGWRLYQDGRFASALSAFNQALSQAADDDSVRRGIAYAAFQLGDYATAAAICADLVSKQKPQAPVDISVRLASGATARVLSDQHSLQAWTLLKLGKTDAALEQFQAVVEKHPGWVDARSGLGYSHLVAGHYAQAEAAFLEALQLVASYPDAVAGHSQVQTWRFAPYFDAWRLYELKRYDAALEGFEQILRSTDNRFPANRHALLHNGIGWACLQLGDLPTAQRAYDRASKLEPNLGSTIKGSAYVYKALERPEDCVAALLRATELLPTDVEVWVALGTCYREANQLPLARGAFERALQVLPTSAAALNGLAWTVLELAEPLKAATLFAQALALDVAGTDSPQLRKAIANTQELRILLLSLGWAHYAAASYTQALADFQATLKYVPTEKISALRGLGLTQIALGRADEARDHIDDYLKLGPRSEESWGEISTTLSVLAWALYAKDEHTAAKRYFQKLITMHGDGYADPWAGLGWCYLKAKNDRRAKDAFLKALAVAPRYERAVTGIEALHGNTTN